MNSPFCHYTGHHSVYMAHAMVHFLKNATLMFREASIVKDNTYMFFLKFPFVEDQVCWTWHYQVIVNHSVLIIFSDSASPEFIKLNLFRQAFKGSNSSTFHDIFLAPPNMVLSWIMLWKVCNEIQCTFVMRLLTRFEGIRRFASKPIYNMCQRGSALVRCVFKLCATCHAHFWVDNLTMYTCHACMHTPPKEGNSLWATRLVIATCSLRSHWHWHLSTVFISMLCRYLIILARVA